MAIQNSAGKSVVQYTYDPFGKCLSVSGTMADTVGSINPLRYRGYYYDNETGYYYLATRYYNPDACRFLNADSLVCSGPGILGYNMYIYCQNNPVMFSDPGGMGNYHDPQMQQMMQEGMNNVQNWNMNDPVKVEDMSDDWKDIHADAAGEAPKGSGPSKFNAGTFSKSSSLPKTGPPNSKDTLYNPDGTPKQDRWYGPNSEPIRDRDHNHGGNHDFPHDHEWIDGQRGPAIPVPTPESKPSYADIGEGIVVGIGAVGAGYFTNGPIIFPSIMVDYAC